VNVEAPGDKMYAVGTESIQTPLKCSLFISLQPFAKIKKDHFISHVVIFQFFFFYKFEKMSTFQFFSVK